MNRLLRHTLKALGLNEANIFRSMKKQKTENDYNASEPEVEEVEEVEEDPIIENETGDINKQSTKRIVYIINPKDSEAAKMKRDFNIIIYSNLFNVLWRVNYCNLCLLLEAINKKLLLKNRLKK
jgi:hypothetical protein